MIDTILQHTISFVAGIYVSLLGVLVVYYWKKSPEPDRYEDPMDIFVES